MSRVPAEAFAGAARGEVARRLPRRLDGARAIQLARQGVCNARLDVGSVQRCCVPVEAGARLLESAAAAAAVRTGTRRVLELARTIADLEGSAALRRTHLAEALALRCWIALLRQRHHVVDGLLDEVVGQIGAAALGRHDAGACPVKPLSAC